MPLRYPDIAHSAGARPRTGLGLPMVLALSACAALPARDDAARPQMVQTVEAARSLPGTSGKQWPAQGLWSVYGDRQLDALMAEGLANAPDVTMAAARYRKAAALAEQAGAARLPTLDVAGQVGLQKQSTNMGFPEAIRDLIPSGWNDGGKVTASLGFDLDLWGRNRAALAAATSEREAAAIDARQAALVLTSGIASAYVDLGRLFAERDVREREAEAAGQWTRLLADRRANGLETRGSVAQGQARAAGARAALAAADEALALRRNQIAALVGAGPDRGLALTRPTLAWTDAPALPADVTTELVGHRPDVAAARARAEAAARRIRVARADFFPAVRLDALFGVQSLGLDLLFDKASTMGSVGPAFSLPIFRGGELRGRYRGAEADYDLAVANYNATVLRAYQQTADAWTSSRLAAQRLGEGRAALAASQDAHDVALARYKAGLATYLDVLQVEDALLAAKLAVAGLEAGVRSADIALIRALGGGFASPVATNSGNTDHG